jgi:hypothetical protein
MTEKKKIGIGSFSKVMSLEEAEKEKVKSTPLGEALKQADREYAERKRRQT